MNERSLYFSPNTYIIITEYTVDCTQSPTSPQKSSDNQSETNSGKDILKQQTMQFLKITPLMNPHKSNGIRAFNKNNLAISPITDVAIATYITQ